jgi:hypothetical protein
MTQAERDTWTLLKAVASYATGAIEFREFNWTFTPFTWGIELWADPPLVEFSEAVTLAKAGYVARHKTEGELRSRLTELLTEYSEDIQ